MSICANCGEGQAAKEDQPDTMHNTLRRFTLHNNNATQFKVKHSTYKNATSAY